MELVWVNLASYGAKKVLTIAHATQFSPWSLPKIVYLIVSGEISMRVVCVSRVSEVQHCVEPLFHLSDGLHVHCRSVAGFAYCSSALAHRSRFNANLSSFILRGTDSWTVGTDERGMRPDVLTTDFFSISRSSSDL